MTFQRIETVGSVSRMDPSDLAAVVLKANLLSAGIVPTEAFLSAYGPPFLPKRRAYGNPDDPAYRDRMLPQELYLLPERLVCAVNVRSTSPWRLDYSEQGFSLHLGDPTRAVPVTFPLRPDFYDMTTDGGRRVQNTITLYGGGSLGIFVYGSCSLVNIGKACGYCSIQPNRDRQTEFSKVVGADELAEALRLALSDPEAPIKQVMINGGNFPDMDKSFAYYARLAAVAREVVDASARPDTELHLIVFPPKDHGLFDMLAGLDVGVAINLEVHDPQLFEQHCPGKAKVVGRDGLYRALEAAAKTLGPGAVHSIFVGGLEPVESLTAGMQRVADVGVTPIINVFHADPDTPLEFHPTANAEEILTMGRNLQQIYAQSESMRPFYMDCGRNSIDTEAYRQLF